MLRTTFVAFAFLLLSVPAMAQARGEAGRFDYYVLALSWSPSWCAGKAGRNDTEQCGSLRRYGFVVHGLWPQYAKGGYPARCAGAAALPSRLVDDMMPLMPSRKLIEHQWAKHGTCSGADAPAYFAQIRNAHQRVRIPAPLAQPDRPRELAADQVEKLFMQSNPGLSPDAIVATCQGNRAAEIRICLDRALNFRDCGREIRDTCKDIIRFPAAR